MTLVIHPGALGDVLLAVPALRALRAGGGGVTLAAQPRIGALLVALGVVDRAIPFDTLGLETLFTDAPLAEDAPLARAVAQAQRVVCWFGARDATFTARLRALAPASVIGPPAPVRADGAVPASDAPPPVWRHLLGSVVAAPAVAAAPASLVAPVSVASADVEAGRAALRAVGWDGDSRVVLVHPGAGGVAKRWPAEGFADVTTAVSATLVAHEGPADAEAVHAYRACARRPIPTLVNPELPTLAGALAMAAAYFGNDSGVSHLAAAVGTPSVVLFTPPMLPWVPWSPRARCLAVTTAALVDHERAAVAAALSALL